MPTLTELPLITHRSTKVLMVMDVVESVRLMELDEDDFVRRWQQLVAHAETQVLPLHGGRIVKSLGDGLMLEFASAQSCTKAAFMLQQFSQQANAGQPADRRMHLRMGGHVAEFVADKHDIYGTDVNLTARFASLAEPGGLVISAELRDLIPTGLDADIEDMGECHLKHVPEPVQLFRAWPVGDRIKPLAEETEAGDFRPTIAVIPFEARSNEPEHFVVGELIADGVIAQLSRSADLRVISRLSTSAFRGRTNLVSQASSRLAASYVLSGSYVVSGNRILITTELCDARRGDVIWAERVSGDTGDLLEAESALINTIASAANRALVDTEVQQSLVQPMPRLDSGSLLLGGIALMHRSSVRDFDRSRQVLEALQDRHGRSATPRAWLAKWYTMRVIRGFSDSPKKDTALALEQTRRALDLTPNNALSLAIEGYARCQLLGDSALAEARIAEAIALNPNESMAWLYRSVWSSMWGSSESSIDEAVVAAKLSPIDPLKYFYDLILATGYLIHRDYDKAIMLARRSLTMNRRHQPALRTLLMAQTESGATTDALETLILLKQEMPNLTVSSYLGMGSATSAARQRFANALRALGVSEF
ncbi:adenylate/guanylate cyclase domain-containing protein [Polaromonas sp. YR568]|uniref:adenylate/guanylate cyclase domain-containing protein n=1 Tax=Polaromonas sp. YR568 TaxID=1855301 RepID=UPI00313792F4